MIIELQSLGKWSGAWNWNWLNLLAFSAQLLTLSYLESIQTLFNEDIKVHH